MATTEGGQLAPGPEAGNENLGQSVPPMTAAPPYHMGFSLNSEFREGASAGSAWGQVQS